MVQATIGAEVLMVVAIEIYLNSNWTLLIQSLCTMANTMSSSSLSFLLRYVFCCLYSS